MADIVDLTGDELVAKPATYFRNARFIVVLMMLGFGVYCLYDGFIKYPHENEKVIIDAIDKARRTAETGSLTPQEELKIREELEAKPKNTKMSIFLNRLMGFLLPPGGITLLAWTLYRSRGVIELKNYILGAPGHPPIPLDAIRRIDQTLWERKGIAYLHYELSNGVQGKVCIDDFIHNDLVVREIMTRIENFVKQKIQTEGSESPKA
jgi:hypothetical protein